MDRSRTSDEHGSILISMLAVLVVGGVVTVLTATMISGQGQTRFDEDFEQALQVAEVGLEEGVHLVQSSAVRPAAGAPATTWAAPTGAYSVAVTNVTSPVPGSPARYRVEATGRDGTVAAAAAPANSSRTVAVEVQYDSLFAVPFLADDIIDLSGNMFLCNNATCSPTPPTNVTALVGTNGEFERGGSSFVGGTVAIGDWGADPDPSRCTGIPCAPPTRLVTEEIRTGGVDFERLKQGCTTVTTLPNVVVPGKYCVTGNLTLSDISVAGASGDVQVFVGGTVDVQGGAGGNINSSGASTRLQIYSIGSTVSLTTGSSHVKALIWAPNATCTGAGNGHFEGTLVCKRLQFTGTPRLYPPQDVGRVNSSSASRDDWTELLP